MSMEMPKGWENLKVYLESFSNPPSEYASVYEALDLMEEMAEALFYCADAFSEIETRDLSLNLREAEKKAIKVLKKWREWK